MQYCSRHNIVLGERAAISDAAVLGLAPLLVSDAHIRRCNCACPLKGGGMTLPQDYRAVTFNLSPSRSDISSRPSPADWTSAYCGKLRQVIGACAEPRGLAVLAHSITNIDSFLPTTPCLLRTPHTVISAVILCGSLTCLPYRTWAPPSGLTSFRY